ncbi:pericentrin isoform X1 [Pygocentrus nattereri]|uniref:pericentrin isoform X1 n=1 Tax=Pygocentrus nattereri TaxID=42514 RepID=UPI001890CDD0|nr:pericentrin isoform X1 [Pygocentrus nattereri]
MDQDERRRKLEAGRAKLAHYRQRRAKGDGANAQKKTPKRKSQTVQTNDRSAQEHHLEEPQTDLSHEQDGKEDSEESLCPDGITGDPVACQYRRETDEADADALGWSLPGDEVTAEQPVQMQDLLGEIIVTHTSKEQLKQLQAAVEKRNEIISQLSINLQAALMSRDQVQLEAQQLTGQIQELQQQLQQAKEYLRSKSVGWVDLSQAQQNQWQLQIEDSQKVTRDQQCLLAQKEAEITALQQKLGDMEDSLSQLQSAFTLNDMGQVRANSLPHSELMSRTDKSPESSLSLNANAVLHNLRTELDEERQNSKRAQDRADSLQRALDNLESEKIDVEARLMELQAELQKAEAQARQAQQYKAEKEELNQDMARLDGLVQQLQSRLQEEEEKGKCLRSRHESEIANYELRLQTLEEERGMNVTQLAEAHEAALKRLREEHLEEVRRIQELLDRAQQHNHSVAQHAVSEELDARLNWVKASKEQQNQETVCQSAARTEPSLDITEDQNDLMERYLAMAVQHESSLVEQSLEEHSLMENSEAFKFELESEVELESRFSDHRDAAELTDSALSVQADQAEDEPPDLGGMSFTQAQWQSFSSTSKGLDESVDNIDLGKELLIQQCRDLTDQLEEKERQLEVLQEEVRCSAEELDEARERWSKASEELEEAKWELEMEREKRLQCEEIISQKTHEQDNLKNKLSSLQSQQEREQITLDVTDLSEKTLSPPEELLKELGEEKVKLVLQLKQQEQLVRDIQEQKVAGDSVSSEVQALFGRQLSFLQAQRDQLMAQLENQREKNQATSMLLGQKTIEVDSARRELQQLRAEVEEKVENLQKLEKDKTDLEAKLMCLKQNLSNMEEALTQGAVEKAALEMRLQALEEQTQSMEKVLESELENFEVQLEAKDMDLEQLKEAKEKAEEELMEKESTFQKELGELRHSLDGHLREHEEEKNKLEEKHQKELQDWNLRLEKELSSLRASLEEEQKKQIGLVKQVHERERQRELSHQAAQRREELNQLKAELMEELRDSMEAAHQAELLQTQTQQALELEALRLSLTNLHTAQLELSQANLQKEKEAALSELQASLREKWAQESAMLQARQQFELERLHEQNHEQETQAQLQHQEEINALKCDWEKRISEERTSVEQQQASKIEDAKVHWSKEAEKEQLELQKHLQKTQQRLTETQAGLTKAEASLAEMQDRLDELQRIKEQEIKNLESDLSQAWADRDSAARAVEELVASHKVVLQEQQAHVRSLEEREKRLQQEVDRLHAEKDTLKSSSEQEINNLWSQLESMRTSRQELGELKEQLLARSSRVDDIERLKQEFTQQRQDLKEQNEAELENLRTYFEQRLRSNEESHREEIALLQLRLVEGALEESVLKTGEASFLSEGKAEEERADVLAEITEQLEKHKAELDTLRLQLEEKHRQDLEQLRCSMALSYREELLQARTELTDRYYSDIEQLNTKHALEIEQLRAKLSDNHIKDITKLRLQSAAEVARQVEAEVEERTRVQTQEHQTWLAQLASETERILSLEKRLAELTLQHTHELESATERSTDELRELEDRLQKNFAEELRKRLQEAQQEERSRVNEELSHQSSKEQAQLQEQLQAEAEERLASLREELQRAAEKERAELEQKLAQAQELLSVEREKLQALQASLESEESPQVVAVKQKLKAQYENELRTAKSTMAAEVKELNVLLQEQTEAKLKEALCRHQEEQRQMEEKLTQQRESDLQKQRQHDQELEAQKALLDQHVSKLQHLEKECQEVKLRHQEELDSLSTNHKAALDAFEAELTEKHRTELDKLQVVLEETNLAQLEAQEAELKARHKQEMEELETRMLSNMDTLESTYLKEIQAAREEKEEVLQKLRASMGQQHAKEMDRMKENLKQELTKVHMDKFSSMATELRHAHEEELSLALSSQKVALEADHHSALEILQQHVLELEKQHSAALQEITVLSTMEKEQLQQQLDTLTAQHQQQLQELRGASAREIEALRRELEEEASRRRLHFLEEAELLKCQSEEQLQQRIAHIKEESEQDKAAALEELEKKLQEQHQQNELCYTDKMSQLTAQLQQLDTVVSQLRSEVSGLQGELEGKRSEMDTLETLLQRRERENQEGANLLAMLRDDLNTATQQRQDLQSAHDRIQRVLLEMLRVTMATEEHINCRLGPCVAGNCPGDNASGSCDPQKTDGGTAEHVVDCSVFSSVTDEGLELSQRLCESIFSGPEGELDAEREELVLEPCTRLSTAVDKLLELVSESTKQLEQMHALQAAVDAQFSEGGEARNALLLQHSQLLEQLDQEASLKSQLRLELHKAEGLMDGYVAEKAILEEALQQKELQEQRLVEELERARVQLQDLSEAHAVLQRQRDALAAGLGDTEKGCPDVGEEKALLAEADRLGQERMDVQRQAEKDRGGLAARLRLLELALEEQEGRTQQQEEQHRAQTEDLQQHIDALEKQLKHHRQFIDEQAVEREHERDEFQQEIKNLEDQLRLPTKGHAGGNSKGQRIEELVIQVESLQALIKDKTEDYSMLLSAKEQCQRDLEERNDEIDKMASRIRELEQALLSSAETGRAVTQLEQELQRARKSLQDLSQDNEALQQQLYSNKLQISALQSKLDETRHRFPDSTADPSLREQLETLQQDLQSKEEQVEVLLERVEELEKALAVREEEVRQLTLQLELSSRESGAREEQLQLHITQLQETLSALREKQEEKGEDSLMQLPAALLEEKNLEIDHLNQQILSLQQELETTKENKVVEEKQAEIEELHAQIERLHSDQERLRQAKEEEAEQLHEVIHKLQEELSQLDPNRHEVSDPSPEPPDFPWSPRPKHGTEESLCQELSSESLQNSRTRLRELQADLEHSAEEKEALQRLLLSQEEQYGKQVETLGRSLGEEKGRLVVLEQETEHLRLQVTEKEDEMTKLQACLHELEDGEKAQQVRLKDLDLQLRSAEERREEAQQELARLHEEARREKEKREKLEGQVKELLHKSEEAQNTTAELGSQITKMEELVQCGRTDIATLETGKKELYMERQALRKREGKLQEEIERLKQEVTSKCEQIQELNAALEERVNKQEEAHKEVLTCAEETLAKAEAALREREEQLAHLRAEHDVLRAELVAVKEGLSTSTERAEKLREEGQTKDRALADLEVYNQRLRAELRDLQDDLAVQEEELAYQQRELDELRQRCGRQEHTELPKPEHRFLEGLSRDASLSSPEVLRRLDCSEERPSRLHASHLSELSALRNTSLDLGTKPSPMERDRNELKRPLMLPPETDPPSTRSPTASPRSLSVLENLSVIDSLDADKVRELENLDVTPSYSPLCSTSPVSVPEWASDGYGSNVSSELEAKLKLDLERSEHLGSHFVEYMRCRGMDPDPHADRAPDNQHHSQEMLSPELQDLLRRVYQESCRVLSLSHRPTPTGQPRPDLEEAPPPSWQRERRALQETVLSLRELLCRMAEREPKADGGDVDWRRELLQAVQSVFDSEREWLHAQLQTAVTTNTHIDHTSLLEQLERLLQKQDEQQRKSLEQLLSADRCSLLTEIRSLHAQLHTCTLQSQEQLRELHNSLHTMREQGMQTQQRLQREVDDLGRQLQQEQTVSRDLHCSLEKEQSRQAEHCSQLEAEQKTILMLKAELQESSLQLQSTCKSQEDLQSQIHKLRLKLENEEQEHQACVEAVEREQVRVKQLQEELLQERLNSQQTLEENAQTQESLRASLSEHVTQLSQLSSALEQERMVVSNLRSELQIEQSRCEALLAQERERTQLALSRLEEERSRTAQLSDSFSLQAKEHARRLEEEARTQEAASAHDRKFIQDLRAQLEQERQQAEELAGMVECLQAQVLQGKRRQEERREQEVQREQEEVKTLRKALESLQAQRSEVSCSLEAERQRASQLQTELDSMKEKLRAVKEREEQREKQRKREKHEQEDKERRQERTNEKLLELEVLRERDQQRLRQLQQTLADLEQQEKRLTSEHLHRDVHIVENTHLSTGHTRRSHIQDSPSSSSSSLVERLLKDNSELAERLAALSEEKLALKHTLSCLERDLQNLKRNEQEKFHVQMDSSALAEKMAWQKEKVALQAALYKAETDLSKATASNENRPFSDLSNSKVQRLYEKYLRAESYRKSLVYQKRYLLLLLGGFQDCEQATLALIARMGAQPSLSHTPTSRPLSRFRSAVRVLIAISRLKFLTRKWQRVTRKGSVGSATVNSTTMRTEVLKPQQTGASFNSPPTRDRILTQRGVISPLVPPVKSPFRLHNRGYLSSVLAPSERTITPSQDQERSLAEYINHLENVQQRLGAIRPDSPSMPSYSRKSDR